MIHFLNKWNTDVISHLISLCAEIIAITMAIIAIRRVRSSRRSRRLAERSSLSSFARRSNSSTTFDIISTPNVAGEPPARKES